MVIIVNWCLKKAFVGHFCSVELDVLRKVVDAARPFLELVQVGNGKLKVEAVLTTHQLLALRVDVGAGERTFHTTLVIQLEGMVQLLVVIGITPTAVGIGIPQNAVIAVAHHKRNAHLRVVLEQLLVHSFIIEVFRLMLAQSVERLVGGAVELQVPCPAVAVVFSQLAITNLTLRNGEGLEGHSFGNLFITAMTAICGDMVSAIKESSKVLLIRGRVLPATCDDMKLYAKMEDDSIVKGESNIPEAGKRIIHLYSEPDDCKPTKEVLEAIHDADLIIMGPGSLYTSVISNFLVKDITRAVWNSKAKKIYVCNAMTQVGETDNYSVSDHIKTIFDHVRLPDIDDSNRNFFDAVLVNNYLPANLTEKYEQAGSLPVEIDITEIRKLKVELVQRNLLEDNEKGLVRHNCSKVAKAIYFWYKRAMKNKNNG